MLLEQVLKQIFSNFPSQKVAVITAKPIKGNGYQLQVVGGSHTTIERTHVGPIIQNNKEIDALASDVNTALGHVGSDVYHLVAESLLAVKGDTAPTLKRSNKSD